MNSYSEVKNAIENDLNGTNTPLSEDLALDYQDRYYVHDINFVDSTALCCVGGSDYYVVPFSLNKKDGTVDVSAEGDWTPVTQGWVESAMLSDDNMIAEMFFATDSKPKEEDGIIYKTILREGVFAYSPGKGQTPVKKPITVVKDGVSDHKSLTISMQEIKNNFDAGAVEHVTVPLTHEDKVIENTGYVRKMRFGTDDKGRATLEAGIEFTEPDV
jgi:hypothetical protein